MGLNVNSAANFSAVYNSGSASTGNWYDGLSASFGMLLNGAGTVGKSALGGAIGGKTGGLAGGGAGGAGGTSDLTTLLEEQNRLQLEMQTFSMISNISKTEHESRMNLVRNMRP